jgi:hypothetical protein
MEINHNTQLDLIEAIIDDRGLEGLADLIAEVCSAKADHINASYSLSANASDPLADQWDDCAVAMLAFSRSLSASLY